MIVEYESLPAVIDPEAALEDGLAARLGRVRHQQDPRVVDRRAATSTTRFASADNVVERRVVNHRTAGAPIETRGAIAEPRGEHVTLYSATQIPHIARFVLSGCCGIPEDKLRVVASDVGGGFGAKLQRVRRGDPRRLLAKRLQRPVKWIETRTETWRVTHHGRDQVNHVEMAVRATAR